MPLATLSPPLCPEPQGPEQPGGASPSRGPAACRRGSLPSWDRPQLSSLPFALSGFTASPVHLSSPLPLATLGPSCRPMTPFRLAASGDPRATTTPVPKPRPLCPGPHWTHTGPHACQRPPPLCRSQHAEYLMSDGRFHLLTQAKCQNNAAGTANRRQAALPGLAPPQPVCRPPPRAAPVGGPPLSLAREFLPEIHTSLHSIA